MPIPLLLLLLIGLHLAAAVFWLFSSALLGWGGHPGASRTLLRPQMAAATLAVFSGGGLWQWLHAGGFGPREAALAAGAALSIAAAGVQGALAGGGVRALKAGAGADALARIARGQRIAAILLALTFACMVCERWL